jgi:WD40 repeat protein
MYDKKMADGDGATRITDFAFTPDGSAILAAYCRGGTFDYPGDFSFASVSGKDPVRLWDVRSGQLLWEHVYSPKAVIKRVVPSPDGKLFAAVGKEEEPREDTLQIHDLNTGERLYALPGIWFLSRGRSSILFTPDSKRLITIRADPLTRKFRPWEHLAM